MTPRLPLPFAVCLLATACVQSAGGDAWRDRQAAGRAEVRHMIAELDEQQHARARRRATADVREQQRRRREAEIARVVAPVHSRVDRLASEIETVRRDRIELEQSDDALQGQIAGLGERLQKEQRAHADLAARVQAAEQRLRSELAEQHAQGRAELAKLISNLERTTAQRRAGEAAAIQKEIARLGDRLAKERAEHAKAVAALRERERELRAELAESARVVEAQLAQAEKAAEAQRSSTATLGGKVGKLRARLDEVTAGLESGQRVASDAARAERAKLAAKLGGDLSVLRDEVRELSSAVRKATAASDVVIREASVGRLGAFAKLVEEARTAAAEGDLSLASTIVDQRLMIEKLSEDLAARQGQDTKAMQEVRTRLDTILDRLGAPAADLKQELEKKLDERLQALETGRKAAERKLADELSGLRAAIAKDVDSRLEAQAAGGADAAKALWTRIEQRLGSLDKSLDRAREVAEKGFATLFETLRRQITADVDARLTKSGDASSVAAGELWKKIEGRFEDLEARRAAAETEFAKKIGALRGALTAEVDAKLAADQGQREETRAADLASMREKLATDLDARLKVLTDSDARLAGTIAKLDAGIQAADIGAVREELKGLGQRLAAEEVRRGKAERDLGARIEVLVEQLGAMHKSVVESLAAKADRSELTERSAAGDSWSRPWVWGLGGALLVVLLWLLLRRGPEIDMSRDEVFVVEDEHSEPPSQPAQELAAAALAEPEVPAAARAAPAQPRREVVASGTAERTGNGKRNDPAPRVQSLRIDAGETAPGGDDAVRGLLECDPRVLVEPAPRIEARPDGSLSIRFYVRGQVDPRDAEELTKACRSLATRGRVG